VENVKNPQEEINRLHNELMQDAKMTLCKAIRIGELLCTEKSKLKHGGWLAWCEANLVSTSAPRAVMPSCFATRHTSNRTA